MKDKIANTIAKKQFTINELKAIKEKLEDSIPGSIQFVIKSKQIFYTDFYTHRDTVDVSFDTMNLVIDKLIEQERERIDKLIDMEIEKHIKEKKE